MQRVCDGCKKVIEYGNFIHTEWDGNPALQRSMDRDVDEHDFHDWDCVEDFLKDSGKADYVRAIKNGGDGK
jgi:hypothetical protein